MTILTLLTVRKCIEERHFILLKVGTCYARALSFYTCHSVRGHILKTHYMVWWGYIMVRIFSVSFQLPPVTERSRPHLNRVYFRFWSSSHLSNPSLSSLQFPVTTVVLLMIPRLLLPKIVESFPCNPYLFRFPPSFQCTFPFSPPFFLFLTALGMDESDSWGTSNNPWWNQT